MSPMRPVGAPARPVPFADGGPSPAVGSGGADAHRDWVAELTGQGAARDAALLELHQLMVRAARHQVARMRPMLPGLDSRSCLDLATAAADDAMVACIAKLHTFEGRSRFTTWAYKFAILQTATEVRRQSWAFREVLLDDAAPVQSPSAGPEQLAEASDLATAVTHALDVALTGHQRRVAIALLVDNVPIDVLAGRLGTSRGSLYKTLHDVRRRLRAHLVSTGHLDAGAAPEEKS